MARRPSTWNCFPIRPDARLRRLEQNFILDGVAAEKQQQVCDRLQPKLWTIIPTYNPQRDPHAAAYYANPRVQALLRKTGQHQGGTSVGGWVVDYFSIFGEPQKYLNRKNWQGAGHSPGQVFGHNLFMSDARPITGYNGRFGYRRTVPALRCKPSVFGVATPFSLY
ncbi:LOW QUALITY PROTEIN: sperm microtubule associated protein 1 [Microcaecilia unicolor]|uniref:LOW QUALITY PROTEIN: uncharacterized protein C17orf98 homolog n=1 Tax=Microcaecilia unicolor TaxID=1415580 RepID=A0A6P7ZVH4_9AMPH|nr:LOW QUALITY PROTEIN: uncharacterized protein C17orf98 homolog [Microcaecilia unicolor]